MAKKLMLVFGKDWESGSIFLKLLSRPLKEPYFFLKTKTISVKIPASAYAMTVPRFQASDGK